MDVVDEVTVIKKTYEAILKTAANNAWVYSYSSLQDFKDLWSPDLVNRILDNTQQEPTTIVVIWDGMPPAEAFGIASLAELITPIDWAVGFSIAVAKASGANASADSIPNLRIVIIDLLSHAYTHAPGIKLINQFPKRQLLSMPWVHVAMPFGPTSISSSPVETLSRLGIVDDAKDQDLRQFPTMKSIASQNLLGSYTDSLSRLWCSLAVMTPDLVDHHSVSNIIAPLVILGIQGDDTCPHQKAVLRLYKWIGLISEDKSKLERSDFWSGSTVKEDLKRIQKFVGKDYRLHFHLIDDAAHKHKWKAVLEDFLGNSGQYCKLTCTDSVEDVLSWLPQKDSLGSLSEFRFRVRPENDRESVEVDILFLDLRLVPVGSSQEREFLNKVIKVAELVFATNSERFVKEPLNLDDLSRVKSYLTHGESSAGGYDDAITLLPRLIASLDPSLPIFVFSSTGRGDILRILSKHPNIFCRWSKPRLQNHAFDSLVSEAWQRFHDELHDACAWIPGRVLSRSKLLTQGGATPTSLRLRGDSNGLCMKIFIDESGRPENLSPNCALSVGGLLCISNEEHRDFTDEFLHRKGFVKYGKDKEDRRQYAVELTKELFEQSHERSIHLVPFSYSGSILAKASPNRLPQQDFLSNTGVGDNLWRLLVSSALEQLIFVYGRELAGSTPVTLEVHIATRRRSFAELARACNYFGAQNEVDVEERLQTLLVDTLGLEKVPCQAGDGVEFVSRETPRSIFQNVREPYLECGFQPILNLVRGFNISDPNSDARPTHFYADALLDMLLNRKSFLNGFCDRVIEENLNARFELLINAQRQLARKQSIDAFLSLLQFKGKPNEEVGKDACCSKAIIQWLKEEISRLKSSELRSLAKMQRSGSLSPSIDWVKGVINDNRRVSIQIANLEYELDLPHYARDLQSGDEIEYFLTKSFDDRIVIDTPKARKKKTRN